MSQVALPDCIAEIELCNSSQSLEEWKNRTCEKIQSVKVESDENEEDSETMLLKEAGRKFSFALQQYIKSRKDALGALIQKQD